MRIFDRYIDFTGKALGVVTWLGAVLALLCMIVIMGFDHSPQNMRMLRGVLEMCQTIFFINIGFELMFRAKATFKSSRWVKWVMDLVLLTTLPALLIHHDHLPDEAHFIYSNIYFYLIMTAYSIIEVSYGIMNVTSRRTNPSLLMSASFIFFILLGTFVLMLPKCTLVPISFTDSIFVATSAVCITGLTPVDISTTFTPLGITVLAVLVQIGGLGVLTFTCFFATFFSGTTSVYNQLLIRDMIYSKTMNALLPTMIYVFGFTVAIEVLGAIAIYFTIPAELGLAGNQRVLFAVFHSLSSFCNAGFTFLPDGMSNHALMTPSQDLYLVTSILIIAGGIGFPILVNFKDIIFTKMRGLWQRVRGQRPDIPLHLSDLNTKMVLTTYFSILIAATVAFFILEYNNTLAGMTLWQKIVQSLFNSLIPRSAGFASVNPAQFMPLTLMMVMMQMWIGGASQSLAGGIKVNTVAAIVLNVRSILRGRNRATAFNRALSYGSLRRATAVFMLAIGAFIVIACIVILAEPNIALKPLLFEVTSALFTVGSSLGATAQLGTISKATLCVAMFVGRVGILSLLTGLLHHSHDYSDTLPEESIIIN